MIDTEKNKTAWHNQKTSEGMIHAQAWDSEEVFKEQLSLNIKELKRERTNYPSHWLEFINIMDFITQPPSLDYNFLDVGCGCGAYIELCKNYNNVKYHGIDFSPSAITVAKKTWGSPLSFSVGDYKDLSNKSVKDIDILHLGAVLDVLPNGDEALRFILDLNIKHLILGRVFFTEGESKVYTVKAYAGKTFVRYQHNKYNFYEELHKRNLLCSQVGDTLYIKGKNVSKL